MCNVAMTSIIDASITARDHLDVYSSPAWVRLLLTHIYIHIYLSVLLVLAGGASNQHPQRNHPQHVPGSSTSFEMSNFRACPRPSYPVVRLHLNYPAFASAGKLCKNTQEYACRPISDQARASSTPEIVARRIRKPERSR